MSSEAYRPGGIAGLDSASLHSPVIPPPEPSAGAISPEPGKIADTLPRVDRYAKLVQAKYRGVQIGSFGFVLEPSTLYEIVESARISPLPGVSSVCKGLINHRSNVVPVYDITALLADAKSRNWERKRLLILSSRENAVGMLLHDLPVQINIDDRVESGDIIDVPEIFHRHASGGCWNNDRLWLNLNLDSFFTELNTLCLQTAENRL